MNMLTCFMLLCMVTLQQAFIMSYMSKMGGDIHDYHQFLWFLCLEQMDVGQILLQSSEGWSWLCETRYLTYHNINTAVILL